MVVTNVAGSVTSAVAVLTVTTQSQAVVTFNNTNLIQINDAAAATPYPSAIVVLGQTGTVGKVTVTLRGLTHPYPHDVGVLVVGPQGQKIVLLANVGGSQGISGTILTFDDDAPVALTEYDPITVSVCRPSSSGSVGSFPAPAPVGPYSTALLSCKGTNPNGTWALYVQDSSAGDAGSIANGWSLNITLDVPLVPLVITQQPRSQTVIAGNSVSFSVAASGTPPLTYQWQRFGTNLSNGGRITGATTSTLSIAGVQNGDAANYIVQVSNGGSSVSSSPAALTVLPAWTPIFSDLRHFENGSFQFTLTGAPGSNYLVQASSDLKNWKLFKTVVLTNGTLELLDASTGLKQRFYRASLAQ